jgi:hypothetical protein
MQDELTPHDEAVWRAFYEQIAAEENQAREESGR